MRFPRCSSSSSSAAACFLGEERESERWSPVKEVGGVQVKEAPARGSSVIPLARGPRRRPTLLTYFASVVRTVQPLSGREEGPNP